MVRMMILEFEGQGLLAVSAAILCTGGLGVIRKEAWPFYRTSSGVRLCWELEEPKGLEGTQTRSGPRAVLCSYKGTSLIRKRPPS